MSCFPIDISFIVFHVKCLCKSFDKNEKFEDTKGIIKKAVNRRRTDNSMPKRKRDKQCSTKHYRENRATRTPL